MRNNVIHCLDSGHGEVVKDIAVLKAEVKNDACVIGNAILATRNRGYGGGI